MLYTTHWLVLAVIIESTPPLRAYSKTHLHKYQTARVGAAIARPEPDIAGSDKNLRKVGKKG